jgi:ABC-type cobalt transport system substrate-binding protein
MQLQRVMTGVGAGVLVVAVVLVVLVVVFGGSSCGGSTGSGSDGEAGPVVATAAPVNGPTYWTEERIASAAAAPVPTC